MIDTGHDHRRLELIDIKLITQAQVRDLMRLPNGEEDGPNPHASGISDTAAVWLVRMRGSFLSDHLSGIDANVTATPMRDGCLW